MAEAVKVIRIELRVGGSSGGSSGSSAKEKKPSKSKTMQGRMELTMDRKLAGAAKVTLATHLLSEAFSISEALSYNSEEKSQLMGLDLGKKAISTSLVTGGYILGGPVGAAVGLAVNQLVVQPLFKGAEIGVQRGLDQTRATNRFYQTDFAGKGTYVFDYARGGYFNEDLEKVRRSSFYKKGGAM